MSTNAQQTPRLMRTVRKLEKPRPLKIANTNRHSSIDARLGAVEEIMFLTDNVAMCLSNGNYDRSLQANIASLSALLKTYGSQLEAVYKDQLDRAFVSFRNGCRDENLNYMSKLYLLELIELRATQWVDPDNSSYYKHKYNHTDVDMVSVSSHDTNSSNISIFQNSPIIPLSPVTPPQPLLLSPGELVKPSGKFAAPTKIPGKNYCKDEVVIRNSDSGKVMGIKGRRVHMIEELSETVISFQRVNPGAKERLVQITGPAEDKILYARQLMEDTIRRNASPVRSEVADKEGMGSSCSLNSSTSEDSVMYPAVGGGKRSALLHSFSTNDATLGEYKYTVTIGDENLKITGTNLDLVRIAKLVLDEYFSPEAGLDEEGEVFETVAVEQPSSAAAPIARVNSQDSEESEDTFREQVSKATSLAKPLSFRTKPVEQQGAQQTQPEDSDVLFTDAPPLSPEERALQKVKVIMYTAEELVKVADLKICRLPPEAFPRIARECPSIMRNTPIEWFSSKLYTKKCLNETDALKVIQVAVDLE